MKYSNVSQKRSVNVLCALLVSVCLGVTALASKGMIQDRRVSFAQAEEMAKSANRDAEFPVVVNDSVLKQLNRYLGTPEGREFMKASLQRMENYRALVSAKLKEYGVPSELMAIPIVESGYQNKMANPKKPRHGAGIWMFMARTAANFGLNVEGSGGDERLNAASLTDAAMRLLLADKLRFKDWQLSVLAFNMGENQMQDAINATHTHDAWKIIEAGYENDKDYLAELMAAILIMKNPSSLE
jgi:membrane-bound lytic murein transglycosylase D